MLDELDYYAEAYNMARLATNLEPIEGVHVPFYDSSLSAKRVLTQEFITGVKISDVEAMQGAGLDVAAIGAGIAPEQRIVRADLDLVDGRFGHLGLLKQPAHID